jgi:hypothetical protein
MELFFPRDIVQTIDLSGLGSLDAQPAFESRPRKLGSQPHIELTTWGPE